MGDAAVRHRYRRSYAYYGARRRRNTRYGYENTIAETVIKQAAISLVVLIVVSLVKSINTAPTNFVTQKIKNALSYHMEIKTIFDGIDRMLRKTDGILSGKKSQDMMDEEDIHSGDLTEDVPETAEQGDVPESLDDESVINEIKSRYTFSLPVDGRLSSPYGYRINPVTGKLSFHHGVDIDAEAGTGIKAALDGVVTETGSEKIYGNYIRIKHADGLETLYAHCSELIAQVGNPVSRGTTIARVGNTGLSVGTHLHFEIRKDGKTLDPAKIIDIPLTEDGVSEPSQD